jgi:AraC-like DNA-binding protein
MTFIFDMRASDSPLVETVWSSSTEGSGPSFISSAASNWEMVFTKLKNSDSTIVNVRGPETQATPAPVPEDAVVFGIVFKLGTFLSPVPPSDLVDNAITLPEASGESIWFHGSTWQIPTFENADTFVNSLVRAGLIGYEPIVEAALQGHVKEDLSLRSVQRRFLRATGLTHGTIYQINRARKAMLMLEQGTSILDTVDQAGYSDQPHMTRALKHLIGRTPAQILDLSRPK